MKLVLVVCVLVGSLAPALAVEGQLQPVPSSPLPASSAPAVSASSASPSSVLQVPQAVATLLEKVRNESDPVKAEALLVGYTGSAHALIALALGNARLQQADGKSEVARNEMLARAETAFANAAQLDPTLTVAHVGLARCAAARGDWKSAIAACALAVPLSTATAADLAFYTDCAARGGDPRLATTLVTQGIMRFPQEAVFRRQELALLVSAERWPEARAAFQALLAATPTDADAWRSLAGAETRGGDPLAARVALEAAVLLKPDDSNLRRALAETQLASGQAPAALATVLPLVADPTTADPRLVEFAARVAVDADRSDQARRWLLTLTTEKRSRAGHLLAARLAAQTNDLAAADAALQIVMRQGEADPAVIAWAGSIAENRNDVSRAEGLYRQADAQGPGVASLRLALLLHRLNRDDEVRRIIAIYREAKPGDPQLPIIERIISP